MENNDGDDTIAVLNNDSELNLYDIKNAGIVAASGVIINGKKVSIKDFRNNNPLIKKVYSWKKTRGGLN